MVLLIWAKNGLPSSSIRLLHHVSECRPEAVQLGQVLGIVGTPNEVGSKNKMSTDKKVVLAINRKLVLDTYLPT